VDPAERLEAVTPRLEERARELLDAAGVAYERVYVYEGCTEEACGPMPRVIVRRSGSVPVCYSLQELQEELQGSTLSGTRRRKT